ncbi:MAG TPA: hypothetical protein VGN73_05020 [Gemmatimonadaceae bacterium]|jgi:hypothetical protein|nr:hypothetical protein [Gemmatimonadaceae bacterium]
MMVLSALRPDASLIEFLAHRARSAPAARLVGEEGAALAVLSAALWWNPPAQLLLVSSAICFASYAAWGLSDRARGRATTAGWTRSARILRACCVSIAAIGIVAGAGVLLSVWALALGTWIS